MLCNILAAFSCNSCLHECAKRTIADIAEAKGWTRPVAKLVVLFQSCFNYSLNTSVSALSFLEDCPSACVVLLGFWRLAFVISHPIYILVSIACSTFHSNGVKLNCTWLSVCLLKKSRCVCMSHKKSLASLIQHIWRKTWRIFWRTASGPRGD